MAGSVDKGSWDDDPDLDDEPYLVTLGPLQGTKPKKPLGSSAPTNSDDTDPRLQFPADHPLRWAAEEEQRQTFDPKDMLTPQQRQEHEAMVEELLRLEQQSHQP